MVAGTWDLLHPAITEDGSGGVYVVCERFDGETSSIWAQRLNGAGAKSWTTPTNVCTALGSEEYPDVINEDSETSSSAGRTQGLDMTFTRRR